MNTRIPFVRPVMPDEATMTTALSAIRESNWHTNFGPYEQKLRAGIEAYVGRGVLAATVSNATVGLMAALAAVLPRGNEDECIAVPSFTFAAGPQAVTWHGYRPAWIDIDALTMQPSLESLEQVIASGRKLRAILLTNTFGIGNPGIKEWENRAGDLGLPLVIDSAAGFGSRYLNDEVLGARGDCEVFSFHATKPFAIGEGGAVVSRDPELVARVRAFTNFGFKDPYLGPEMLGLNGKLAEIPAAIGVAQLLKFDNTISARQRVLGKYMERLERSEIRFPSAIEQSSAGFAAVAVKTSELRDEMLGSLVSAGVDAKSYYSPPAHRHRIYSESENSVELPVTSSLSTRMLSLPVLSNMTEEEIERVIQAVERHL